MSRQIAIYFANHLRAACLAALADTEAFNEIIHVVERLGSYLKKKQLDLGKYRDVLTCLAERSSIAEEIPGRFRGLLTPFSELYESVRIARNDALHQGAFARHLTTHAIELAIVLEDALRHYMGIYVSDFMTRNPVCAEHWQPVSFIRQEMLTNSFSYLPVTEKAEHWYVVSDVAIARYLGSGGDKKIRNKHLMTTLKDACREAPYILTIAKIVDDDTIIQTALGYFETEQVLLVKDKKLGSLLGILTAFDLL